MLPFNGSVTRPLPSLLPGSDPRSTSRPPQGVGVKARTFARRRQVLSRKLARRGLPRPRLDLPRRSHRLTDEGVGLLIADESLRRGVKLQRAPHLHGNLRQVDERGRAVPADLVKRELLTSLDRLNEVRELGLGVGQLLELRLQIGDIAFEVLEELALGTGNERRALL